MIKIEWKMDDLLEKIQQNRRELDLVIAASLQTNRGMLFAKEGAYNGHPGWAPLKFRNGMILSDRGTLRKSLAPQPATGMAGPDGIVQFQGDMVTIGTRLAYAAMMNWGTTNLPGGVLRPVKAKALKIPVPKSIDPAGFIFRKSVRIPARRFDELNDQDQAELREVVTQKVLEILNR